MRGERPEITAETFEFLLNEKKRFCIANGGFDFQTVSNNTGIRQKLFDFF